MKELDHVNQRNPFLSMMDALRSNCLILVRCRDKHVLTSSGIGESLVYKLTGLNREHSLELFCLHALLHQQRGFEYLVGEFLMVCDRLPLFLKVFGSNSFVEKMTSLLGKTMWIDFNMYMFPERYLKLFMRRHGYGHKNMERNKVERFVGFRNLENKCLVEVDRENRLKMHDHLGDLRRDIANQEKSSGLSRSK